MIAKACSYCVLGAIGFFERYGIASHQYWITLAALAPVALFLAAILIGAKLEDRARRMR